MKKIPIFKRVKDPCGEEIILTRDCYFGHIFSAHPNIGQWIETVIETIRNPEGIFKDKEDVLHYIGKIQPEIRGFFDEDDEFLEIVVKKMYHNGAKKFLGMATFFSITAVEKQTRTLQWRKTYPKI